MNASDPESFSDRDPLLEHLRSENAFASDRERIARAAAQLPQPRSRHRFALSVAAAALLALLAWRLWPRSEAVFRSEAVLRSEGAPQAMTFAELPPALAAIEDLSLRGDAAESIAFLRPTHDVFVLTPEREPRFLFFLRAAVRGQ